LYTREGYQSVEDQNFVKESVFWSQRFET
jgi:hypothetical protein